MLDDSQLEDYLRRAVPSELGRNIIRTARASDPLRNPTNARGNWAGKFPSQKILLSNPFESWTGERALLLLWDFDSDILEVWAQAVSMPIRYRSCSGRPAGIRTVFDFLVLRRDAACITDFKTSSELHSLVVESPHRWVSLGAGRFDQPPARQVCESHGLQYELLTEHDIPHMLIRNIDFLKPRLDQARSVPETQVHKLQSLLATEGRVTIASAIAAVGDASVVFAGHFEGRWALNLRYEAAALPDSSFVYKDITALNTFGILDRHRTSPALDHLVDLSTIQPGTTLLWDGTLFTVIFKGKSGFHVRGRNGEILKLENADVKALIGGREMISHAPASVTNTAGIELLRAASDKAIQMAASRLEELDRFWSGAPVSTPRRTLFDQQKRYRDAQQDYGNGFLGLIDHDHKKGNRCPRTDPSELELRQNAFLWLMRPIPTDVAEGFSYYLSECSEKGVVGISQKAFTTAWKSLDERDRALLREGRRAAYPQKSPRSTGGQHIEQGPPEGDSPFQLVHIDHVQSDVFVRRLNGVNVLAKPWLSIAIDAFSRLVLALWLSVLPPSHASVMMVLRDMVRRHGRLPQWTCTDGGKDFQATRVQTFLASYGCGHAIRPNAEPRYGNPVERLNLDINTYLAKATLGGNEVLKTPRMSSQSHDPRILAILTLKTFAARVDELLFDTHPHLFHTGLKQTPFAKRNEASLLQGTAWGKATAFNESLVFQTLVRARRHGGLVRMRDGVRLNSFNYFNPAFSGHTHQPLREVPLYDPEDPTYIYFRLDGPWTRAVMIDSQLRRLPPEEDRKFHLDEHIFLSRASNTKEERYNSNLIKGKFFHSGEFSLASEDMRSESFEPAPSDSAASNVNAAPMTATGERPQKQEVRINPHAPLTSGNSAAPTAKIVPISWRSEDDS